MASVVFSTVGQALGGPLGAAVGAAVGGSVDAALFGARRGVAGDLLIQRSAYGDPLPRLYGRTRMAGVVIWAQPMAAGGGKGSGRQRQSSSFAVALSSRPIEAIGRIWADGREIRNADGQFESSTDMRLHRGVGRQAPDPLIVAAETEVGAAGYRGLAYVVFEGLDLEPFGNRIPNLSFEVFADEAASGGWLADLAGPERVGAFPGSGSVGATGYAALGDRSAEDVAVLARVCGAEVGYPAGRLRLAVPEEVVAIPTAALAAVGDEISPVSRSAAWGERPGSLSLDYLDPDREFQAGRQTVARGRRGVSLASAAPLAATAEAAKSLAGLWLRREEAAVETMEVALGWAWLGVSVGDRVRIGERPEIWRVVRRTVRGLMVHLLAELTSGGSAVALPADGGRSLPAPVSVAGPTSLRVFETAFPLREGVAGVWITGSGGPNWRGAAVSLLKEGAEFDVGMLDRVGDRGELLAPLPPGPDNLWDEENVVTMRVSGSATGFENRSALAVLSGANLARVGSELMRFRDVRIAGAGVIELRGLIRGCFATSGGSVGHPAGAGVELVLPERTLGWPAGSDLIGSELTFLASGPGDPPGGTEASLRLEGIGGGAMAPVHLVAGRRTTGEVWARWIARGRSAIAWDGAEPDTAGFLWQFEAADGRLSSRFVAGTAASFSTADQLQWFGTVLGAGYVSVIAVGSGPAWLRTSARVAI